MDPDWRCISKQQHGDVPLPGSSQRPPSTRRTPVTLEIDVSCCIKKVILFWSHSQIHTKLDFSFLNFNVSPKRTDNSFSAVYRWLLRPFSSRLSWLACRYCRFLFESQLINMYHCSGWLVIKQHPHVGDWIGLFYRINLLIWDQFIHPLWNNAFCFSIHHGGASRTYFARSATLRFEGAPMSLGLSCSHENKACKQRMAKIGYDSVSRNQDLMEPKRAKAWAFSLSFFLQWHLSLQWVAWRHQQFGEVWVNP